jgi:hypothetical protein
MRLSTLSRAVRYAIAILIAGAGVGLRALLDPWLGSALPLVMVFGAVAAAAWLCGSRPALVAAVAGYLATDLVLIGSPGRLDFHETQMEAGGRDRETSGRGIPHHQRENERARGESGHESASRRNRRRPGQQYGFDQQGRR